MPLRVDIRLTRPMEPRAYDPSAANSLDLPAGLEATTVSDGQTRRWNVVRAHLTERLGEPFTCDVLLARKESLPPPPPPEPETAFDKARDRLDPLRADNAAIDNQLRQLNSAVNARDLGRMAREASDVANAANDFSTTAQQQGRGAMRDFRSAASNWEEELLGIPQAASWVPEQPPDPTMLLGRFCSLRIARNTEADGDLLHGRWISGIVWEFEDLGNLPSGFRLVRVQLVPQLRRLELRKNHFVFERMDAVRIAQTVIERAGIYRAGIDTSRMQQTIPIRDRCIQYGETDFDFVQRLLREEGLVPVFAHHLGCEQLRIVPAGTTSDSWAQTLDAGLVTRPVFIHRQGPTSDEEVAWDVRLRRAIRPVAARQYGYDFSHRDAPTTGSANADDPQAQVDLFGRSPQLATMLAPARTVFAYRDETHEQENLASMEERTRIQLGELRSDAVVIRSLSNASGLSAGLTIQIAPVDPAMALVLDPALSPYEGTFTVTEMEAVADTGLAQVGPDDGADDLPPLPSPFRSELLDGYVNRFTAVPSEQVILANVRPRPAIDGMQTALVMASASKTPSEVDTIGTDGIGRVRLRCHWDRRNPDDERPTSGWARVTERWAGEGWGTTFLPREGMEAVVGFVDGQPESPVVLGCLYSFANRAPRERPHLDIAGKPNFLPDVEDRLHYRFDHEIKPVGDRHLNLLRTKSENGDRARGYHEVSFDDTAGKERIRIHSEGDLVEEVEHDHSTMVDQDQINVVLTHQVEEVEQEQTVSVVGSRTKLVDGHERIDIEGSRKTLISGQLNTRIKGSRIDKVAESETIVVGEPDGLQFRELAVYGHRRTTVEGNDELEVKREQKITVGGNLSMTGSPLSMAATSGPAGEAAPGIETDGKDVRLAAPEGKIDIIADEQVMLDVKVLSISGEKAVRFEAGDDVFLELGPDGIEMKGPRGVTLQCRSQGTTTIKVENEIGVMTGPDPGAHADPEVCFIRLRAGGAGDAVAEEQLAEDEVQYDTEGDEAPATAERDLSEGESREAELFDEPGVLITGGSFMSDVTELSIKSGQGINIQSAEDGNLVARRYLSDREKELFAQIQAKKEELAALRAETKELEKERNAAVERYRKQAKWTQEHYHALMGSDGVDEDLKDAVRDRDEARRERDECQQELNAAREALRIAEDRGEDTEEEDDRVKAAEAALQEAEEELSAAQEELGEENENHDSHVTAYDGSAEDQRRFAEEVHEAQNRLQAKFREIQATEAELQALQERAARETVPRTNG